MALTVHSEPPQSYSAGFELRGTPAAGELQLTSPLGTVLAAVHWSPQGAELKQGNQLTRRASLDELTADIGGTPLPVTALFGWLQGQAAAADGWTADLSRQSEGRVVARRLQPSPTAELRLVFQP
ncbi:lipoprotein insertase outer membrane protein LolB [Hydrogenophaga luteola]|uniref:Outer-membrane lipoprotein LolB n=1 Tax=Hydrogenophaga luteola TaxID=1591122 RepID=A0ABV7W1F2_9BURK